MLHQGPKKRDWFESWEVRVWYMGKLTISASPVLYSNFRNRLRFAGRIYCRHPWDATHSAYHPGRDRPGGTHRILTFS